MGCREYAARLPLLAGLVAAALSIQPALAEKRVALIIGNGDYRSAPTLPNPRNDAADVAASLRRTGFETDVGFDLDKAGMDAATIRFARAARDADVAIFYYSGHALQFGGVNYLMPVDARLTDEADLRLMLRLDGVVADLQQARNLRILVLDSCRDNPLAETLKRSIGTTRAAGMQRGLARIDAPQGMIVAYATQSGRTADDGDGRNSPYTRAFLGNIESVEEIGTIFRRISADVYNATQQKQLPELSLSFIGEFYLNGRPSGSSSQADVAALRKQLQTIQDQLKQTGPSVAALAPVPSSPLPAPPADEPLPADVQIDASVLAQIESHAFFANAPPIAVATYASDSSLLGRGVVNGTMTTSESSTGSVSRRLRSHVFRSDSETRSATRHTACSPACRSDSVTVSLSAANGLIGLGYKSSSTTTAPRMRPMKFTSLSRLLQVTNFSGHVYPVEVGNQFSWEEISETNAAGSKDETITKNSCSITRKFDARSFHSDLTGTAYLSICEVQTLYKKNSAANSRSQSRSMFFEKLGIWASADPIAPKERIMQGDLYGSVKEWTYSGSDALKSFSLLR
jgi:caspase domain-containing protein